MTVETGTGLEERVRETLIPLPAAVQAADTFPVMSIGEDLTELVTRENLSELCSHVLHQCARDHSCDGDLLVGMVLENLIVDQACRWREIEAELRRFATRNADDGDEMAFVTEMLEHFDRLP